MKDDDFSLGAVPGFDGWNVGVQTSIFGFTFILRGKAPGDVFHCTSTQEGESIEIGWHPDCELDWPEEKVDVLLDGFFKMAGNYLECEIIY
jgi:hypothetical protein